MRLSHRPIAVAAAGCPAKSPMSSRTPSGDASNVTNRKEIPMRLFLALALAAGATAAAAPVAAASSEPLGSQVSTCAQTMLPPLPNPPTVTCSCNGTTMTFATFGEMVQHMLAHG
jgi:hypothetical protein